MSKHFYQEDRYPLTVFVYSDEYWHDYGPTICKWMLYNLPNKVEFTTRKTHLELDFATREDLTWFMLRWS